MHAFNINKNKKTNVRPVLTTHTHTRTRAHTHAHRDTHAYKHTRARIHACTQARTLARAATSAQLAAFCLATAHLPGLPGFFAKLPFCRKRRGNHQGEEQTLHKKGVRPPRTMADSLCKRPITMWPMTACMVCMHAHLPRHTIAAKTQGIVHRNRSRGATWPRSESHCHPHLLPTHPPPRQGRRTMHCQPSALRRFEIAVSRLNVCQ